MDETAGKNPLLSVAANNNLGCSSRNAFCMQSSFRSFGTEREKRTRYFRHSKCARAGAKNRIQELILIYFSHSHYPVFFSGFDGLKGCVLAISTVL